MSALSAHIVSARKQFPKMPAEAFDQWIAPQVAQCGWPFLDADESVSGAAEAKHFRNKDLDVWSMVNWTRVVIKRGNIQFEVSSDNNASEIYESYCIFIKTKVMPQTKFPDSVRRFEACARFVVDHGKLPKPMVCFIDNGATILLDGHHRLAAMNALKVQDDFPVDMWLGK